MAKTKNNNSTVNNCFSTDFLYSR